VNRHHTCHTSHVWYRLTRYPKVWLYASIITILAEWGCYDYVQGRRQALGAHPNEIRWGEFYSRSPAPHRADFDRINQATRHLVSCSKFYKLLHDEGLGYLTPCLACCIVAIRLFNPIVGENVIQGETHSVTPLDHLPNLPYAVQPVRQPDFARRMIPHLIFYNHNIKNFSKEQSKNQSFKTGALGFSSFDSSGILLARLSNDTLQTTIESVVSKLLVLLSHWDELHAE